MKRRDLLYYASLGAGAALAPTWLQRAFAQSNAREGSSSTADSTSDLRVALDRAKLLGKPLLVLVIPDYDGLKRMCGEAYGTLFSLGDEEVLADLSMVEVVCATRAEIESILPNARAIGSAAMLLVEVPSLMLWPIRVKITPAPNVERSSPGQRAKSSEEFEREVQQALGRWVRPIAEALHANIACDSEMIEERALVARNALGDRTAEAIQARMVAGDLPEIDEADRVAAIVRLHAERFESGRKKAIAVLAKAARKRLWDAPPRGARYASQGGCGLRIEGPPPKSTNPQSGSVACGMGHVPPASRRFLWFFAVE